MTTTPLVNPTCQAMKRHMIEWYGLGLCCLHDYRRDQVVAPRSFTVRAKSKEPSA